MLLYISFIRLTTGCYTYRNSIFKHHLWYIAIVQCTQNSTDSNKLVIFSSITLYYDDTDIMLIICLVTLYYNPSLHIFQIRNIISFSNPQTQTEASNTHANEDLEGRGGRKEGGAVQTIWDTPNNNTAC